MYAYAFVPDITLFNSLRVVKLKSQIEHVKEQGNSANVYKEKNTVSNNVIIIRGISFFEKDMMNMIVA